MPSTGSWLVLTLGVLGLTACTDVHRLGPGDVGVDASGDGSVRVPCGSQLCGADEVCVVPCCGGPAVACVPADDAGTCPPGTSPGPCLDGSTWSLGCTFECIPPAPFCFHVPPACGATPDCGCVGVAPREGCPQCGRVTGRTVECQCG